MLCVSMLSVIVLSVIVMSVIMLSAITLSVINLSVIMMSVIVTSVIVNECHCTEYRYAECHCAECHSTEYHCAEMLSIIMLSVIILSVTAPDHLKQRNQNRRYRLNCFKNYFCLFLVTLPHQLTVLSFRCQNNDFKRHIWLQLFCPNAIYPNDTFMRLRQRGVAPNPLALAIKVTEVSSP